MYLHICTHTHIYIYILCSILTHTHIYMFMCMFTYGGLLKWGYPYIIHFNKIFYYEPAMLE